MSVRRFAMTVAALLAFMAIRHRGESIDSTCYLAMVQDLSARVPAPYAMRLGVPALAQLLPLEPEQALELITLMSLIGYFVALERFLVRLRVEPRLGWLITLFSFYPMVYSTQNPHVIDPLFLCLWVLAARLIYENRPRQLGALLLVGVLVKEALVFTALAYAVYQWLETRQVREATRAGLWGVPAVVLYVLLRLLVDPPITGSQFTLPIPHELASGLLLSVLPFLTWIFLVSGNGSPRRWRFLLAGIGAVLPMLFLAHDSGRMLGLLLPFWLPSALPGELLDFRERALVVPTIGVVSGGSLLLAVTLLELPHEMLIRTVGVTLIAAVPLLTELRGRRIA